jgi:hypothetical protein
MEVLRLAGDESTNRHAAQRSCPSTPPRQCSHQSSEDTRRAPGWWVLRSGASGTPGNRRTLLKSSPRGRSTAPLPSRPS